MFYADLHLHSKHSIATSRDADLEHLSLWARRKGLQVVGTGDFTHPEWLAEIGNKLVPAEPGLFRLRPRLEREVAGSSDVAGDAPGPTRFMLEVEISTVYRQNDRTRKVHHLVYVPDLKAARRLVSKLGRIGNLASDGRPTLKIDSRSLLELVLESSPDSYLVPAHIWTPWFSVLGSKSGFDSIEDCYGDLTPHIFALETGLSADPTMIRRLSQLDRYTLVSNSDAHSPAKLAREASVFTCELSYFAMRSALQTGQGFGGTREFFPEEGKYFLDGHRNCQVCLQPAQTRRRHGTCPACSRALTVGVLNRVEQLADRAEALYPAPAQPFRHLVALPALLAEIGQVGAGSKQVGARYNQLLSDLGPELFILEQAGREQIERAAGPELAEAIARMRAGRVIRHAGYDGLYGTIRMFEQRELTGKGIRRAAGSARTSKSPLKSANEVSEPVSTGDRSPGSEPAPAMVVKKTPRVVARGK